MVEGWEAGRADIGNMFLETEVDRDDNSILLSYLLEQFANRHCCVWHTFNFHSSAENLKHFYLDSLILIVCFSFYRAMH